MVKQNRTFSDISTRLRKDKHATNSGDKPAENGPKDVTDMTLSAIHTLI